MQWCEDVWRRGKFLKHLLIRTIFHELFHLPFDLLFHLLFHVFHVWMNIVFLYRVMYFSIHCSTSCIGNRWVSLHVSLALPLTVACIVVAARASATLQESFPSVLYQSTFYLIRLKFWRRLALLWHYMQRHGFGRPRSLSNWRQRCRRRGLPLCV